MYNARLLGVSLPPKFFRLSVRKKIMMHIDWSLSNDPSYDICFTITVTDRFMGQKHVQVGLLTH